MARPQNSENYVGLKPNCKIYTADANPNYEPTIHSVKKLIDAGPGLHALAGLRGSAPPAGHG